MVFIATNYDIRESNEQHLPEGHANCKLDNVTRTYEAVINRGTYENIDKRQICIKAYAGPGNV